MKGTTGLMLNTDRENIIHIFVNQNKLDILYRRKANQKPILKGSLKIRQMEQIKKKAKTTEEN